MKLSKFIFICFWTRVAVGIVHAFAPLTSPHTFRQVDTLAVALRYWHRWTIESTPGIWWVPAVLNSGDSYGYMAMECPLLNMLVAPAFSFGIDAGRVIAHLILLAVVIGLVYLNRSIWKEIKIFAVSMKDAVTLAPIFSFSTAFTFKFIPDVSAFLCVAAAIGLLWSDRKYFFAFLLISAGLLIKPVAITLMPLLLLRFSIWRALISGAATAIAATYYVKVNPWIESLQTEGGKFYIKPRPPLKSLLEFFGSPAEIVDFFSYHLFAPILFWLVILAWVFVRPSWKLMLILLIQITMVAALDGSHAFVHAYYFTSCSLIAGIIFIETMHKVKFKWIQIILGLFLVIRLSEASIVDLKGYYQDESAAKLFLECRHLRKKHPEFPWNQGQVFRSSGEMFPLLGVCFGERQDSKVSDYGFFYKNQDLPQKCQKVDETSHIILARC